MPSVSGRPRLRWPALPAWLDNLRERCDVCGQLLGAHGYYVQEEPDVPDVAGPPQGWTLCQECSEAVWQHVERMELPESRRLRVAVGLVASERATPEVIQARTPDAARDQRADRRTEHLLIWLFAIVFVVHALVFILVLVEVAAR